MELILKYFPDLTEVQCHQFGALDEIYRHWNAMVNVISRKDIDNLYTHHVLHSLGITQAVRFRAGSEVMDLGTGGGFPGIPLAILFPDTHFHLIDSIGKKIKVVDEVVRNLGLQNVTYAHKRAQDEHGLFDFVVSRAVMPLAELERIVRKNISPRQQNAIPNGIVCLKGGDLSAELQPFRNRAVQWDLNACFHEDFFQTKKVVYLPVEPQSSHKAQKS